MSNRKNIKKEEINAKNDVNRKGKITYKQMSNGGYIKLKVSSMGFCPQK